MEYVKAIGEVPFRKDIVSSVCGMMLQDEVFDDSPLHIFA